MVQKAERAVGNHRGGLTGDAQLGDRVFIKRFKRVHRGKLVALMREKWRDAKRRQISRDGYIYHPNLLRPNAPDRVEQINLIVSAWKKTFTADIEKKTDEVQMKCYELAQETGWTPAKAFEDLVAETGLEKELWAIRNNEESAEALQQQQLRAARRSKNDLYDSEMCEASRFQL